MTEQILELVPVYGLWLLAVVVYLSCLALPVPSSLVMLASGSFAAAGDLAMVPTFATALAAAIAGDQTGYLIGRKGGTPLLAWFDRKPDRKAPAQGSIRPAKQAGEGPRKSAEAGPTH